MNLLICIANQGYEASLETRKLYRRMDDEFIRIFIKKPGVRPGFVGCRVFIACGGPGR